MTGFIDGGSGLRKDRAEFEGFCSVDCSGDGYRGPWYECYEDAVYRGVTEGLESGDLYFTAEADFDIPAIAGEYFIYDPSKGKFRVSPVFWGDENRVNHDAFWALAQKHARTEGESLAWFLSHGADVYGVENFYDLCEVLKVVPPVVEHGCAQVRRALDIFMQDPGVCELEEYERRLREGCVEFSRGFFGVPTIDSRYITWDYSPKHFIGVIDIGATAYEIKAAKRWWESMDGALW